MGLLRFLFEAVRGDAAAADARRSCPLCNRRKLEQLDRHSWRVLSGEEAVHGTTTVLRCLHCDTLLFEEQDTGPMTAEQRGAWLRKVAPPA